MPLENEKSLELSTISQSNPSGMEGGSIAQWLAYLLPDPAAPGLRRVLEVFLQNNFVMLLC